MSVNISNLNRDKLLQSLWENSQPAAFFTMSGLQAPKFDIGSAKRELRGNYADYICGRVIKADIYSSDTVDPWGYDRDNGAGSFQRVVDRLRSVTQA